jgi:DNA excision repair protein ERCC-3
MLLDKPLVIQNDFTVLLQTGHPDCEHARYWLSQFADLIKSPSHLHTYRITPLSLWNAAASGIEIEQLTDFLEKYSQYGIPTFVKAEIVKNRERYGLLRIDKQGDRLFLVSEDQHLLQDIVTYSSLCESIEGLVAPDRIEIKVECRGTIKQELMKLGYPVDDLAGYESGEALSIKLREQADCGRPFVMREYQRDAVNAFYQNGSSEGGNGVIVLPCGAGKTIVGLGVMEKIRNATLIVTTNTTSVRQWIREILDKTNLTEESVGEYTGQSKHVRPVTVATYQILAYRRSQNAPFRHMQLFSQRDWGLIIYDEVHLLPAPVFRITAGIQAKRRLGLTATLVREDGCEQDVFSLVGPKRYDMPWKQLEQHGHIAKVTCAELRVPLGLTDQKKYIVASKRAQFQMASINVAKLPVIEELLKKHGDEPTLIIGHYLEQLQIIAERTNTPMIYGETTHEQRDDLYMKFQKGEINRLVVSSVANFAVNLPRASVAIEVSGSFGSRQEEAQRLGRILRPKPGGNRAFFYTIVSDETTELDYALHRQRFLVEQGYNYELLHVKEAGFPL